MNPKILEQGYGFAAYPSIRIKNDKVDKKGKTKFGNIKQLIFGDFIRLTLDANGDVQTRIVKGVTYFLVKGRSADGYVREEDILPDRILEVNFVDIGQGDGCHIVTPDDKHFLIDAGESDNMYRFLKWRFNLKYAQAPPPPFTVITSHSDIDHYKGFDHIFTPSNETRQTFRISKVYHNGLVELSGAETSSLGTQVEADDGIEYITDLVDTNEDFNARAALADSRDTYVRTLKKTTAPKESLRYGKDKHIYKKGNMTIEVLGPVPVKIDNKDALPVFKDKGKTKNGHSVMLMLKIGKLKIFLGGDLNTYSEDYILSEFGGDDVVLIKKELSKTSLPQAERDEYLERLERVIEKSREKLQCDIAKSCHHGSSDFTSEFLKALNPIATVISSGDDEPHCHPRPDTLGTIGKFSRGDRSLIFSTELSRSAKEFLDVSKIRDGVVKERIVTRYGMINVRSDGEKVIIATMLEQNAARGEWDIHELTWDEHREEFTYKGE